MSCFLFQNSILGNDPLVKNKAIINPCEKQWLEFPWMSLPSPACTVFVWPSGEDGTVEQTTGSIEIIQRDHQTSSRLLLSTFVCISCSSKTLATWIQVCARSRCYSPEPHDPARQSHNARAKSVGRKSPRGNNSPQHSVTVCSGSCLCFYPITR